MKKNYISAALFISFLYTSQVQAGEIGGYFFGISYHIGANSSNPAYSEAPRGLDSNGAFVFNPGFGLGYDFRNKEDGSSLSLSTIALSFRDCNDEAAYATGIGPRYRYYLNDSVSLDADLYLALYIAPDWETKQYNNSLMPFPSVGVNYHWDNFSVGLKTTYAPKNEDHSSTAGFNLLFNYLYLGYSL